jgi:hypothetical protein
MPKRPLKFLLLVAIAACLLMGWLWFTTPEHTVTKEAFRKIKYGMSEAEIVELLKGPGGEPIDRLSFFDSEMLEPFPEIQISKYREWSNNGATIAVGFDDEGKVAGGFFFRVEETAWERARRWLRLE